jgi:anti-anti-sigma factor
MSSAPTPEFPITVTDQIYQIHLPDRLTVIEAVALKKQCQELLQQHPVPKEIVLEIGDTLFIDSSGIGALVSTLRTAQALQVGFRLNHVQPSVQMTLEMLDLESVFQVHPAPLTAGRLADPLPGLPLTHPSVNSKIKRLIDIFGALVGLTMTGMLLIPVAIAIQLDNPGPLFFRQTRCGLMGKRFKLWKFRSMVTNAEDLRSQVKNQVEGPMFKNENDPRITRVGRFLRKTSLDEFPQFWNVLQGDMSLVGTRPPTPDEIERYEIPSWQRLNVKPGMTGEWQVYGRSRVSRFEDVIELDLRYQERWSLGYDLKLIVQTVLVLFSKDSGAY